MVQAPRSPCRLGAGRRQQPPSRSGAKRRSRRSRSTRIEPHPERVGTIGPYRLIGRITCGLGWYSRREWSANTATIEHWSTLAIVAGNHRCSILPPPVTTGRQTSIGSPMLIACTPADVIPKPSGSRRWEANPGSGTRYLCITIRIKIAQAAFVPQGGARTGACLGRVEIEVRASHCHARPGLRAAQVQFANVGAGAGVARWTNSPFLKEQPKPSGWQPQRM
jgi:hypothetical protein